MPPSMSCLSRLSTSRLPSTVPYSSTSPISLLSLPSLSAISRRNASILSRLHDVPGAFRTKRRAGRGPSSGKGKTSGRGHKGQKQHGKVPAGFNGGQTPLEVVHGTRGFKNNFALDFTTLNLDKLTSWVAQKRIDPSYPITIRELRQSRCISNVKDGVKLLAKGAGDLPGTAPPLNIVVSRASAAAIAAIEARGGSVTTRYYTNFAIRQICKGRMDPVRSLQSEADGRLDRLPKKDYMYRLPDPSRRKDIEYYRDPAHRGYLSHTVPEGQGPSLFFKTPGTAEQRAERAKMAKAQKGKTSKSAENRIW